MQQTLVSTKGLSDVTQPADEGLPELLLKLDPVIAGHLGIDPSLAAENVVRPLGGNLGGVSP